MTLTPIYRRTLGFKKKVLNFRVIPPPHTGSLLAEYVTTCLREWGIENKVFTITLDNTTNNNGLVECLKDQLSYDALVYNGEFIHVRCCAHVLNLIVQSGLKVIEESIEKVQEYVKFMRGSAARMIKFAECIARLKLQCHKNVRQDVVTRWNYTYLMLDYALVYRRAYVLLAKLDKMFKTCPTEEEWTRMEAITMLLKPFYEITKLFSIVLICIDEDEVDEKELIDEDIEKLVKSSTASEVRAAEEKKEDKEESDDDMGFSFIDLNLCL
ncbi:zinc finger BED domain-containing protein RICESLEEPER 2-like protein [Tanacetum coccineum]